MAAAPELPALVDPAIQDHHPGKIIFAELVTPDIAAARRFYAGLFGWTFQDIDLGRIQFTEASLDGRPVAGMIQKEIPASLHRQPAWLTFIAARDVDASRTLATQHGARVLLAPRCFMWVGPFGASRLSSR